MSRPPGPPQDIGQLVDPSRSHWLLHADPLAEPFLTCPPHAAVWLEAFVSLDPTRRASVADHPVLHRDVGQWMPRTGRRTVRETVRRMNVG
jgi:uncharacterized protein (DUF2236 family)